MSHKNYSQILNAFNNSTFKGFDTKAIENKVCGINKKTKKTKKADHLIALASFIFNTTKKHPTTISTDLARLTDHLMHRIGKYKLKKSAAKQRKHVQELYKKFLAARRASTPSPTPQPAAAPIQPAIIQPTILNPSPIAPPLTNRVPNTPTERAAPILNNLQEINNALMNRQVTPIPELSQTDYSLNIEQIKHRMDTLPNLILPQYRDQLQRLEETINSGNGSQETVDELATLNQYIDELHCCMDAFDEAADAIASSLSQAEINCTRVELSRIIVLKDDFLNMALDKTVLLKLILDRVELIKVGAAYLAANHNMAPVVPTDTTPTTTPIEEIATTPPITTLSIAEAPTDIPVAQPSPPIAEETAPISEPTVETPVVSAALPTLNPPPPAAPKLPVTNAILERLAVRREAFIGIPKSDNVLEDEEDDDDDYMNDDEVDDVDNEEEEETTIQEQPAPPSVVVPQRAVNTQQQPVQQRVEIAANALQNGVARLRHVEITPRVQQIRPTVEEHHDITPIEEVNDWDADDNTSHQTAAVTVHAQMRNLQNLIGATTTVQQPVSAAQQQERARAIALKMRRIDAAIDVFTNPRQALHNYTNANERKRVSDELNALKGKINQFSTSILAQPETTYANSALSLNIKIDAFLELEHMYRGKAPSVMTLREKSQVANLIAKI